MDNNSIATLQDYKELIEKIFKKIEKELKEYTGKDTSLQNKLLNSITNNQSKQKIINQNKFKYNENRIIKFKR